jgi:hypothetical protein
MARQLTTANGRRYLEAINEHSGMRFTYRLWQDGTVTLVITTGKVVLVAEHPVRMGLEDVKRRYFSRSVVAQ